MYMYIIVAADVFDGINHSNLFIHTKNNPQISRYRYLGESGISVSGLEKRPTFSKRIFQSRITSGH